MTSTSSHTPSQQQTSSARKWLVAVAVMLGAGLEVLDTSIVNVALPYMQGSFAASRDEITWVLTSYLVSNGIMIPMTGWMSARFGRKRYFLASVVMFVAASGLCGAAQSLEAIVVFRLLQGAAGAAMIPSSQAILMETFPPAEQGMAMALWGLGLMVAPIMGPTLGGWITVNWTWRWNFYINLPSGLLTAAMVYSFVEDPPYLRRQANPPPTDYLGMLLLATWLGLLQIVLDRGQRSDWFAASWVWWFSGISGAAMIGLIIHELRFPHPILDLRIMAIPVFTVAVALAVALYISLFGVNLLNPLYTQELMGYDAWAAGRTVGPRGIMAAAGLMVTAQLSRRSIDTRPLVGIGYLCMTVATWTMSQWNLDLSMRAMLGPILLYGFGSGMVFPVLSATSLSCVPRERMGYAASLYNMVRNTGAAVGVSMVSNLLESVEQVHQTYLAGHVTAFDVWRLAHQGYYAPGSPLFDIARELTTNQKQGLGMVYHTMQAQASLLTYTDVYRLLAALTFICIPGFLILRRPATSAGSATH
jgi:DHA2 family multidrug resistance protein